MTYKLEPDIEERIAPKAVIKCYRTRNLRPVNSAIGVRVAKQGGKLPLGICLLYIEEWPGWEDPLVFPVIGFYSLAGYMLAGPLPAKIVEYLVENGVAVITWDRETVCRLKNCYRRKVGFSTRRYCLCIPGYERPSLPELEASIPTDSDAH